MKYLRNLLLLLLLSASASAQSGEVKNVIPKNFIGVFYNELTGYYTVYQSKNKTKDKNVYTISHTLGNQANWGKSEVEVPAGAHFLDMAPSGLNIYIAFRKGSTDYIYSIIGEARKISGEAITQHGTQVPAYSNSYSPGQTPVLKATTAGVFYLSPSEAGNFRIQYFDMTATKKWEKDYKTDTSGKPGLLLAKKAGFSLALSYTRRKSQEQKSYFTILDTNGIEIEKHNLSRDGLTFFPTAYVQPKEGPMLLGGYYLRNGRLRSMATDGWFMCKINAQSGEEIFMHKDWNSVELALGDSFQGRLKGGDKFLIVRDILQEPEGNYSLVTESFALKQSASSSSILADAKMPLDYAALVSGDLFIIRPEAPEKEKSILRIRRKELSMRLPSDIIPGPATLTGWEEDALPVFGYLGSIKTIFGATIFNYSFVENGRLKATGCLLQKGGIIKPGMAIDAGPALTLPENPTQPEGVPGISGKPEKGDSDKDAKTQTKGVTLTQEKLHGFILPRPDSGILPGENGVLQAWNYIMKERKVTFKLLNPFGR